MLVNMKEILSHAEKNHYAIACINTPSADNIRAVIGAAEELNAPVIIDHAQVHDPVIPIEVIGPQMVACAKAAKVPVCVHLDHGTDYTFIMKAIHAGFSSIMYDCSLLPYEENKAKLTEFTKLAHGLGITVEAELGVMASTGEDSHGGKPLTNEEIKQYFTDPQQAGEFAEATGVDALAVCFGTMHGIYAEDPVLDIDRVKAIRAAMPDTCRVVMHGASGVQPEQVRRGLTAGCSKINYYSYMGKATTEYISQKLADCHGNIASHELYADAFQFMQGYAKDVIQIFLNGYQF